MILNLLSKLNRCELKANFDQVEKNETFDLRNYFSLFSNLSQEYKLFMRFTYICFFGFPFLPSFICLNSALFFFLSFCLFSLYSKLFFFFMLFFFFIHFLPSSFAFPIFIHFLPFSLSIFSFLFRYFSIIRFSAPIILPKETKLVPNKKPKTATPPKPKTAIAKQTNNIFKKQKKRALTRY